MVGGFMHTAGADGGGAEAGAVLTFLQMEHLAAQPARGLPLAVLKRLELARALATRPKLILLDGIGSGLTTDEAGTPAGFVPWAVAPGGVPGWAGRRQMAVV